MGLKEDLYSCLFFKLSHQECRKEIGFFHHAMHQQVFSVSCL